MAKKKKPTVPAVLINSPEGLEAAFNRYVSTRLSLAKAKARLEEKVAKLNAEYDKEHAESETAVLSLETGIELYCRAHRAEILPDEAKRKSVDFANGRIGFRDNPTSVGKIVTKDTFERIAERVSDLEWGEDFVNWKCSLDKELLITRRAELTEEQLLAAGVRFEKSETFYIEPASDLLAAAKKVETKEAA